MDHEGRLLRQGVNFLNRLFQRAERVGVGGLVKTDMAVADLQEGKTTAVRGLRFAHNSERVRHAAGNGPQHARATPSHAFENLAPADAVLLPKFLHLQISFEPRPCYIGDAACKGQIRQNPVYSRVAEEN
jgi:hypothetical protein